MKRIAKWLGLGVAGLFGLIVLAIAGIFAVSAYVMGTQEAKAETLARPSASVLADAPRQARILGCVTCHGEGLTGKLMADVPNVVRVYAPNLTEVAARSTDQQLAAAIRQGIGHDGRPLLVMPSPQYSRLSDAEVAALIAFIRSQPHKAGNIEGASLRPIGRFAVATGKMRPAPAKMEEFRTRAPISLGPEYAAGQRLAAKDCSDCHGPALEGQVMEEGSRPPDLTIAGAYDYEQFRTLLRTGKTPGNKKLGLMKKVAEKDFVHLTDEEIRQLHSYLRARAEKLGS